MSFEIKNHRDLTLVPIHILRNPKLSLAAKEAAAVMYSHGDLHCSETEIANLLGVSKELVNSLFCELQNAGYENIFMIYDWNETDEKAAERCAANLKNC
ncbi:MAG: hypothetical protein ACI3XD_05360 [Oscillospiraceae bacterium]